jgi:hypothetical protein
VGGFTDDPAIIELYFGYARDGRAAVWVHVSRTTDPVRARQRWSRGSSHDPARPVSG